MFFVHFLPMDRRIGVAAETPLLDVAAEAGIAIRTDCGASGVCGKCNIRVKHVDGTETERLACRVVVDGDMEVFVPKNSLDRSRELVVQLGSPPNVAAPQPSGTQRENSRYAVAFDIGTTTLAMELIDVSEPPQVLGAVGRVNPQRKFGDDIVSRIQAAIDDPVNRETMRKQIIDAANELLQELADHAGIVPGRVERMAVAGNTVMEYLFLGLDPSPLGFVPFLPPVLTFPPRSATELGLAMAPHGTVDVLPIMGGFVGGDLTAGVLATRLGDPDDRNGPSLLIDIGTNGELVLWTGERFLVAATAAGPAFEGARIEKGTAAIPGAIERVDISETGNVSVRTIANRPAVGICGSGLLDAAAELLNRKMMRSNGRFDPSVPSDHWMTVNGKPAFRLDGDIYLTQRDVQQLQLAIGAIRAGTEILLRQTGLRADRLEMLYVAGGFGSYIDPFHAQRLGLLPAELAPERISFCGNTSLAGARRFLLEGRLFDVPVHHVELAHSPDFTNVFAESMIFPERK